MKITLNLDLDDVFKGVLEELAEVKVRSKMAKAINQTLEEGVQLIRDSMPDTDGAQMYTHDERYRSAKESIQLGRKARANFLQAEITANEDAVHMEYGSGVHNERPGAPRAPYKVVAKNPRTINYTSKKGTKYTRTVTTLTFKVANGTRWVSMKEVTVSGMRPVAMFRRNLPRLQALYEQNIKLQFKRLFKGR